MYLVNILQVLTFSIILKTFSPHARKKLVWHLICSRFVASKRQKIWFFNYFWSKFTIWKTPIPDFATRQEIRPESWEARRVLSDLEKLILYIFISVKAINAASEAIALDNNNEKAFFRRGDARIEIKDYEEAKIDFKKVLEINKVLYNCSHIISKFSNQKQLKARNISCA